MNLNTPFKLIALVGGSGAGKSWLAERLRREFGDASTSLSLDHFYRDLSHLVPSAREKANFDYPGAIDWPLFEAVLRALQHSATVFTPRYDFVSHTRLPESELLIRRPFIFVEGLWLLRSPHIRRLFHLRVFLDCPESLRWQRRLTRDRAERGRTPDSIRKQFWGVVVPLHNRFVETQKTRADLVIDQPISNINLRRLIATIRALRTHPDLTSLEIPGLRTTTPQVPALQTYEH